MKLLETLALESLSKILEAKPYYDQDNKTPGGAVTEWFKAMGVEPEHIKDAMELAMKLPSFKSLASKFKFTNSAKAAKNGTFQFKSAKSLYSVYGNGIIRQESRARAGYNHFITKLKAPKPALVHGSPVKSLVKIYDNAFKELDSKKLTEEVMTESEGKFTVSQVEAKLTDFLKKAEKEYSDKQEKSSSIPLNTTMSAVRGGMVSLEKNVIVHGAYNSSTKYHTFLKIGGKLYMTVQKPIQTDLKKLLQTMMDKVNDPNGDHDNVIKCKDGTVIVGTSYGRNWGGIGFISAK